MPLLHGAVASANHGSTPPPFVLGTTKPTAANTGLSGPTTTVDSSVDAVIGAGSDIYDTHFLGNVRFTAARKLFNCQIDGKQTTTTNNIARVDVGITGYVELERCLLKNSWFPTNGGNGGHGGLKGAHFKTTRCDISGAADGFDWLAPGDCFSFGDYVHGLWFMSPNSQHPTDGSHCDGGQGQGQTLNGLEIFGSNFDATLDPTLPNNQCDVDPVYSGTSLIAGNPWHTNVSPTFYNDRATTQGFSYTPWGTGAITFGWLSGSRIDNLNVHSTWLNGGSYSAVNFDNRWTNLNTSNLVFDTIRLGPNTRDVSGGRPYGVIAKSTLPLTLTNWTYQSDDTPVLSPNLRRNG